MTTLTIVSNNSDWEGLYIGDRLDYQNHNVDQGRINRAVNNRSDAQIENRTVNMQRLGLTQLPDSLEALDAMERFADQVENNREDWADRLRDLLDEPRTREEIATEFDLTDKQLKVLTALFSCPDVRASKTPLGNAPLIEFGDTAMDEPTTYRLV